jgi:hypothetical protein
MKWCFSSKHGHVQHFLHILNTLYLVSHDVFQLYGKYFHLSIHTTNAVVLTKNMCLYLTELVARIVWRGLALWQMTIMLEIMWRDAIVLLVAVLGCLLLCGALAYPWQNWGKPVLASWSEHDYLWTESSDSIHSVVKLGNF